MNEFGYCKRHFCLHEGRLKELALDPGPKGEAYRMYWDKEVAIKNGTAPRKLMPRKIPGCSRCGQKPNQKKPLR